MKESQTKFENRIQKIQSKADCMQISHETIRLKCLEMVSKMTETETNTYENHS